MNRILKMEFRRLFKSVYFYAFPAVVVFILLTEKLTAKASSKMGEVLISKVFSVSEEMMVFAIVAAGIMAVYLWAQEYKKGYIKNIAGNVSGRHIITLSRLIIGAFIMFVDAVFSFLFGLFYNMINSSRIILGESYPYPATADEMPEKFRHLWVSPEQWKSQQMEALFNRLSQYLLMILAGIAVIAFILMIFEIFRSSALSYTMVILIGFNFVESIIINIVGLITDKIDIAQHLILTQFSYINGYPGVNEAGEDIFCEPHPMWTFWLRTACYVLVFTIVSIYVSRKKDVT